jgi:hypothetical protein
MLQKFRRGSTSCVPRSRNCICCVPGCLLHVYQLRPRMSASRVSVASQGVCFTCICCVTGCLLHVYLLRHRVSASRVSVASGVVNPKMTSWVPRLVRNCISCIERYGYTKCSRIGRFLHSFIVLYFIHNYMHTYRIVE